MATELAKKLHKIPNNRDKDLLAVVSQNILTLAKGLYEAKNATKTDIKKIDIFNSQIKQQIELLTTIVSYEDINLNESAKSGIMPVSNELFVSYKILSGDELSVPNASLLNSALDKISKNPTLSLQNEYAGTENLLELACLYGEENIVKNLLTLHSEQDIAPSLMHINKDLYILRP